MKNKNSKEKHKRGKTKRWSINYKKIYGNKNSNSPQESNSNLCEDMDSAIVSQTPVDTKAHIKTEIQELMKFCIHNQEAHDRLARISNWVYSQTEKAEPRAQDFSDKSDTLSTLISKAKQGCGKEVYAGVKCGEIYGKDILPNNQSIDLSDYCPTCQASLSALLQARKIIGDEINRKLEMIKDIRKYEKGLCWELVMTEIMAIKLNLGLGEGENE